MTSSNSAGPPSPPFSTQPPVPDCTRSYGGLPMATVICCSRLIRRAASAASARTRASPKSPEGMPADGSSSVSVRYTPISSAWNAWPWASASR